MKIVKVLVLGILLLSCKEEKVSPEVKSEITVQYQEIVTTEIDGRTWTVEFLEVNENSLCPAGATCVWQGRIVVSLKIEDQTVTLGYGDLSPKGDEKEIPGQVFIDGIRITISEALETEEKRTTKIVLVFEKVG